jgi:hypothetical protein
MVRKACLIFLVGVTSISFLATAASANPAKLKCNSTRDQIWVYDSLNSFNVDAKLKCGEDVEVIERVPSYVKIRAQNGVEGYVPDAVVADLPPVVPNRDSAHDIALAAKQVQAREVAKAAANAASLAPAHVNYASIAPVSAVNVPSAAKTKTDSNARAFVAQASLGSFGAPKVEAAPTRVARAEVSAPPAAPQLPAAPSVTTVAVSSARDSERPTVDPIVTSTASETTANSMHPSKMSDPNCHSYFSAYGLTPSQTKWIMQNRQKSLSGICPAPDPSKVDFVIIFTHDVDFFSGTMPTPVHKSDGFSDFTPLTPLDTALIPISQADSARREYVWVFQFEKGAFDPASFSAHRPFQFSKVETSSVGSRGSLKTVEDAFRFVASANR